MSCCHKQPNKHVFNSYTCVCVCVYVCVYVCVWQIICLGLYRAPQQRLGSLFPYLYLSPPVSDYPPSVLSSLLSPVDWSTMIRGGGGVHSSTAAFIFVCLLANLFLCFFVCVCVDDFCVIVSLWPVSLLPSPSPCGAAGCAGMCRAVRVRSRLCVRVLCSLECGAHKLLRGDQQVGAETPPAQCSVAR